MEISGFFCNLDFTWNQFWSFWSSKNCHFYHFSSSEVSDFGFFTLSNVWISQKSKFRASKMATSAVFEPLKFPNSIFQTILNFQHFSSPHFLRQINFCYSKALKNVNLSFDRAQILILKNLPLLNSQICHSLKIKVSESWKNCQNIIH